jgi:hypothetical protein
MGRRRWQPGLQRVERAEHASFCLRALRCCAVVVLDGRRARSNHRALRVRALLLGSALQTIEMGQLNTRLPVYLMLCYEDRLARTRRDYGEVQLINRVEDRALGILSLLLFMAHYSTDPPAISIAPIRPRLAARRRTR